MTDLADRLGRALLRAPVPWGVASVLLMWTLVIALPDDVSEPDDAAWLTWAALALMLYAGVGALLLLPRLVYPRARARGTSESALAFLGWTWAFAPFFLGLSAAFVSNAPLLGVGFLVSVGLLVVEVRRARRVSRRVE